MLRASPSSLSSRSSSPAQAQAKAVEGFVGVTERGSIVRFTSETPYSLTKPRPPSGLAPGERLVAVGRGERGVVAVGSARGCTRSTRRPPA